MNLLDDAQIHLEVSSNCNSRCLDCSRFVEDSDQINPWIEVGPKGNMSFQTLHNIFDAEVCRQIRAINFTGTYGESAAHPEFLEIIDWIGQQIEQQKELRKQNGKDEKILFRMETNGGLHSPSWWNQLGFLLKKYFSKKSHIVFGLDGINNETHQLYRRGVQFEKAIANARVLKDAGIRVVWSMIVFSHNEHQIEEARQMALAEGFDFKFRRSRLRHRKDPTRNILTGTASAQREIVQKNNESEEILDIVCEWREKKQLSIDYDGRVWQCCYFSVFNHPRGTESRKEAPEEQKKKEGLLFFEEQYEANWNMCTDKPLAKILQHEFFQKDLPNSLQSESKKTIKRCIKHCGSNSRKKDQELISAYK